MAEESTSVPRVHMSFQVRRVGKSRGRSIVHFQGDASSEIGAKSALYDPNPREQVTDICKMALLDSDTRARLMSGSSSSVSFKSLCFRISSQSTTTGPQSGRSLLGNTVSQVQSLKVVRIPRTSTEPNDEPTPSERIHHLNGLLTERISLAQNPKTAVKSPSMEEYGLTESMVTHSRSETSFRSLNPQKPPSLNLRFIRFLASGSYASVHVAYDQQIKKKVAVKIFERKNNTTDKDLSLRVAKEVRMLERSQSPGVVSFYRFTEDRQKLYIILEYSEDWVTFESYLKSQPFSRLSESYLKIFAKNLLKAVDAIHIADVAHFDLKPTNILVDSEASVKLIDFGSADFISKPEVSGIPMGTKTYMAPELKFGRISHLNGVKADVWSIGRTIQIAYFGNQTHVAEDADYARHTIENFLAGCLTTNVSARACVKSLLKHPWLQVSTL